MKKLKIVVFIVLIAVFILNINCITVMATEYDPIRNPGGFKPDPFNDNSLNERIGSLLGFIQVIGIVVSVIVLMVLGIKYMVGSVEEKAINKKAMIPYLVGAVMVFTLTTIPNFIYQFTEGLFEEHNIHYHNYDENGYCICGAERPHIHQYGEDGKCECGAIHSCEYDTSTGKCKVCGEEHEHYGWLMYNSSNGMPVSDCAGCGYSCKHRCNVNGTKHTCSICGMEYDGHIYDYQSETDSFYCVLCDAEIED